MDEHHKELLDHIKNAISETVLEKKIGIAFSGGVDSTLISKICSDMNYDITLLTIGFPESHDILFAKEVNEHLKYLIILWKLIQRLSQRSLQKLIKQ